MGELAPRGMKRYHKYLVFTLVISVRTSTVFFQSEDESKAGTGRKPLASKHWWSYISSTAWHDSDVGWCDLDRRTIAVE